MKVTHLEDFVSTASQDHDMAQILKLWLREQWKSKYFQVGTGGARSHHPW